MRLCGLGSFLLQDMFLILSAFAFEGQNKKFTVIMLLTCILYCDAGPGCLIRTVCKYNMLILITDVIFAMVCFSSRRRGLTSRKLYVCPQTFLYVSSIYLVELISLNVLVILHFVRSTFKCSCFRPTLFTILRTVYPIGRISSGLSPDLLSILHVDLISCR